MFNKLNCFNVSKNKFELFLPLFQLLIKKEQNKISVVFNQLETGTYDYTASDGTDTWSGQVTITEGCTTLRLY